MKTTTVKISEIKSNPNNPRVIRNDKFLLLVKSIKEFPKMLELRPIVVNEDMVVLGGNQRLKACKEAGLKEVAVIKANDLTEEEQRQFIVKDNVGSGDWDWGTLDKNWDADELTSWGLSIGYNTNDAEKEWLGMPEYKQDDLTADRQLIISFRNKEDLFDFAKFIGQTQITEKTKSVWYPKEDNIDNKGMRYE